MNTRTYEMMKNKIWTFLEVLPTDSDGGLHMLQTIAEISEQILRENEQRNAHVIMWHSTQWASLMEGE
jgi:hypothetical protein